MQKVKLLKDYRVALNLTQTVVYKAGETYEVNEEMCKNMFHDGVAELVKEKPAPEENKAVEKAPENKFKGKKKKK